MQQIHEPSTMVEDPYMTESESGEDDIDGEEPSEAHNDELPTDEVESVERNDFEAKINERGFDAQLLADCCEMKPFTRATAIYGECLINDDPATIDSDDVPEKAPWAFFTGRKVLVCVRGTEKVKIGKLKTRPVSFSFAVHVEETINESTESQYECLVRASYYKNPKFELDDYQPVIKDARPSLVMTFKCDHSATYYTLVHNILAQGLKHVCSSRDSQFDKALEAILKKERCYKLEKFYKEIFWQHLGTFIPKLMAQSHFLREVDFGYCIVSGTFPGCEAYYPEAHSTLLGLVHPSLANIAIPSDVDYVNFAGNGEAALNEGAEERHVAFSKKLLNVIEGIQDLDTIEPKYENSGSGGKMAKSLPSHYVALYRTVPDDEESSFPTTGDVAFPNYLAAPHGVYLSCIIYVGDPHYLNDDNCRTGIIPNVPIFCEDCGITISPQFTYFEEVIDGKTVKTECTGSEDPSIVKKQDVILYPTKQLYVADFPKFREIIMGQEPLDDEGLGLAKLVHFFLRYPHNAKIDFLGSQQNTPREDYEDPIRLFDSTSLAELKKEEIADERYCALEEQLQMQAMPQKTVMAMFNVPMQVDPTSDKRYDAAFFAIPVEKVFDVPCSDVLDIRGFGENSQKERKIQEYMESSFCVWEEVLPKESTPEGLEEEEFEEDKMEIIPAETEIQLKGMTAIATVEQVEGMSQLDRSNTLVFPDWTKPGRTIAVNARLFTDPERDIEGDGDELEVEIIGESFQTPSVAIKTEYQSKETIVTIKKEET